MMAIIASAFRQRRADGAPHHGARSTKPAHLSPRVLVVVMRLKLRRNGDGKHTFKVKVADDGSDLIDKACEIFVVSPSRLITFYDDEGSRVRSQDFEDGDIVYVAFEGGEFLPASTETAKQTRVLTAPPEAEASPAGALATPAAVPAAVHVAPTTTPTKWPTPAEPMLSSSGTQALVKRPASCFDDSDDEAPSPARRPRLLSHAQPDDALALELDADPAPAAAP